MTRMPSLVVHHHVYLTFKHTPTTANDDNPGLNSIQFLFKFAMVTSIGILSAVFYFFFRNFSAVKSFTKDAQENTVENGRRKAPLV